MIPILAAKIKILIKKRFSSKKIPYNSKPIELNNKKQNILFIDHYVPQYDKDAGSRTIYQYLTSFKEYGFNVIFIPDDFLCCEPYTEQLERIGITILYGKYYAINWKSWFKNNCCYINHIFLSRPTVAISYIDFIKKNSKLKIFYYGHDLHYLREYREYQLNRNIYKLFYSYYIKQIELFIIKKCNIAYYGSTKEIETINKILPSVNCKLLPINIFPKNQSQEYNEERKNIMFVGNYNHTPNLDGILWFINYVFPSIIKNIPDITLYLIGPNVTDEIKNKKNKNINILGYVDDNLLKKYYNEIRISIAPLRFGAGIKGKLLEAMYNQIPVITTSIGAEGLPDIEECIVIEDNPNVYAEKLINMYNDYNLLRNLSKKGFNYIMKYFTYNRFKAIINEDFYL